MHTAYILLGSNLGNRLNYLEEAKHFIQQNCGTLISQSGIYETAAWGLTDQPAFYNQAIILKTKLAPKTLMLKLLGLEEIMGRKRLIKHGPRIIDIDIQLMDDVISKTEVLILPHPFLHQRRFALLPLAEVAPTVVHPIYSKTIAQLLADCTDDLEVKLVENSQGAS